MKSLILALVVMSLFSVSQADAPKLKASKKAMCSVFQGSDPRVLSLNIGGPEVKDDLGLFGLKDFNNKAKTALTCANSCQNLRIPLNVSNPFGPTNFLLSISKTICIFSHLETEVLHFMSSFSL